MAVCFLTPSCTTNSSPMGKREKLTRFRAKQPIIIAISQAGPAASIQKSSSFRAYYELIIRTVLRTLPDFSFLEWTAFVSLT